MKPRSKIIIGKLSPGDRFQFTYGHDRPVNQIIKKRGYITYYRTVGNDKIKRCFTYYKEVTFLRSTKHDSTNRE